MGYYLALILLPLAAALQSTWVPLLRIDNGQPDLVLLLVAGWAVRANWREAIFWAFVGGIAADLLSVLPTGTSAIALLLMVFAIRALAEQLYGANALFLVAFVIAGTLLQEGISTVILTLIGFGSDLVQWAELLLLPTLFYNLILTLPVYWLLRRIQKRLPNATPRR